MENLTPMMKQYFEVKNRYPDSILFFRLGDFYEMFFDDALIAARILDITITGKSCGLEERAPMCGVPFHSAEGYIQKLILAGKKVAICEQIEDPKATKGLVKRDVIRVVTPGTNYEDNQVEAYKNSYLLGIEIQNFPETSISFTDISTGEFNTLNLYISEILEFVKGIGPKEVIIGPGFKEYLLEESNFAKEFNSYIQSNNLIITESAFEDESYKSFFEQDYISKYINNLPSINLVLGYILSTQKTASNNISQITAFDREGYMRLSPITIKNLELIENSNTGNKRNTLFDILDNTATSIGKRTLRKWIERPLNSIDKIEKRLNIVEEITKDFSSREELRELLGSIYDIERITSKISYGSINPKDIVALKNSLSLLPGIKQVIAHSSFEALKTTYGEFDDLKDIYDYMDKVILEEPSISIKDGEVIKSDFNPKLEEYRYIEKNASKILQELEIAERERTGIKTLKVGYNRVFGYYIEITKSNLKDFVIPQDYIRKQTISNSERFISENLKEIEEKILNARQKIYEIQSEIFNEFKDYLKTMVVRLLSTAKIIGLIDAHMSLGISGIKHKLVRPQLNTKGKFLIVDGRHPVIENIIGYENYVPNDCNLNSKSNIQIITGPNMGGKSTYMRQSALIAIMAHVGSFIPASSADISIIDAVYTRVGAADDLSQGQSTFMMEMTEVSDILKSATSNSLIILDEVGRGTSTFDGLSIAWAIVKYISENTKALTLFSTHYHEITELEDSISNVKNFYVAVDEKQGKITFLRKVLPGKIDKSYGIHVAEIAGLPQDIIDGANLKLKELETKSIKLETKYVVEKKVEKKQVKEKELKETLSQISFEDIVQKDVLEKIKTLDLNTMTPIQALNYLDELKKSIS